MVSHSMLMAGVFAAATLYYVRDSGLLAGASSVDQSSAKEAHSANPTAPPAELNVLELDDLSSLRVRFDYCTS